MASSVDNRVVSMKFDNADFQNKVGPTLAGLDKLKAGLNLNESANNLNALTEAGKRFNLDGIAQGVQSVADKFNMMGVVAFSVLNNITTMAMNAGTNIVKSLTLQPVMQGYQEFETQMGAIQTILANTESKGTTLPDVTAALDELNTYADKTIYNFTEMTKNIGKFTTAGVDLDQSVVAIKGFSNAAALAGANSEQTARAMFQLSQSMSSGQVRLMDWMSIENAGIASEAFRNSLIETAKVHGTNVDKLIKDNGSFRLSLQEGWLTTEIMTETLSKFTGDLNDEQLKSLGYTQDQIVEIQKLAQTSNDAATKVKTFTKLMQTLKEAVGSGWAKTFQLVIGDFEQGKELFTGLSDIFGGIITQSSEARNKMLESWRTLGGREALVQTLREALWGLLSIFDTIKKAFQDVFPPMTAWRLVEITRSLRDFVADAKPSAETLEKLRRIFSGVFSVLSIGWAVFKTVAGAIRDLWQSVDIFRNSPGGILEFFAKIGDGANRLREIIGDGSGIKAFLDKYIVQIADFINKLRIDKEIEFVIQKFGELKDRLTEFFSKFDFSDQFDKIVNAFKKFFAFFKDEDNPVNDYADASEEQVSRLERIWDALSKAGEKLGEFFDWLKEKMSALKDAIMPLLTAIGDAFGDMDFSFAAGAAGAGGLGIIFLGIKKFIDSANDIAENVKNLFGKDGLFEQLTNTLEVMQGKVKAEIIKKIAEAVAILTAALFALSFIDPEDIAKSLTAVAIGFGELAGALVALDKIDTSGKKVVVLAGVMVTLAGAIVILSGAVGILSLISAEDMYRSIAGIAAMLTELGIFVAAVPDDKKLLGTAIAMQALGGAVVILVGAVSLLAMMEWDTMVQGLTGLAAIIGSLAIVMPFLADPKLNLGGGAFIGLTIALLGLTQVVKIFGEMDRQSLLQGILATTAVLAALTAIIMFVPAWMNAGTGMGLVAIAASLLILTEAVKRFGEMDSNTIIVGMASIALALTILVVAINALSSGITGALALVVVVGSLYLLYGALKLIGEMDSTVLVQGLLGVAAAFAIFALGGLLLTPVLPTLFGFGLALVVIGAGAALLGLGIAGVGAAIWLVADAIVKLKKDGREGIQQFLDMLPQMARAGADAIGSFIVGILENVPAILDALSGTLDSIAQFLIDGMPRMYALITSFLQFICQLLRDNAPMLNDTAMFLLISLLNTIRENIGQLAVLGGEIIVNMLNGLSAKMPDVVDAAVNLLIIFLWSIGSRIQDIIDAGAWVIGRFIDGISEAITGNGEEEGLLDKGFEALKEFLKGITDNQIELVNTAVTCVILFGAALVANAIRLTHAAFILVITLINGLAQEIEDHSPELRAAGGRLAIAIIDGMTGGLASKAKEVADSFWSLGEDALGALGGALWVRSPSKATFRMGQYVAIGLANGISADTQVVKAMEELGNNAVATLGQTLSAVSAASDILVETNPVIKPVLDLSNVDKGMSDIDKMLAKMPTIATDVSFNQASALAVETKKTQQADQLTEAPKTVTNNLTFEQNINAPSEIGMGDIYRQTKSQFVFAEGKMEELVNELN